MGSKPVTDNPVSLLYVEDEPLTRDTVCSLIRRKFPHLLIHTAENGREGLALFRELAPDMVMTDIRMPEMNGIEMAREIRAVNDATGIIVTTAHNDMEYFIDAIEIGISRYVMKPIDKDRLFAALEYCITEIQLKRQVNEQQEAIRTLTRAVEQGPCMVVITDTEGVVHYANSKSMEITGYAPEELIGQTSLLLRAEGMPAEISEGLRGALKNGAEWCGEFLSRKKGGETYWESASVSPGVDTAGAVTHYVAVKQDITERKRAEQEIAALNGSLATRARELEIANKELESFGYTVSHDLRSPLTIINGYCQVMQQLYGDSLNDQCRDFVKEMYNETIAMNRLIDTLLNFSRLSRKELHREVVDLGEMAQGIAAALRCKEPARRVELVMADSVPANGDADLLRVVLDNLLGNAWKYTGRADVARIEFGVSEGEGAPVYFIRDNGAGFDMAHADKLFAAFQRLHNDDEFEGIGIGLATVQRIIQRHGGRIWAEGAAERGATFYFTLPSPPGHGADDGPELLAHEQIDPSR
jgi:PAS domain S-box-containing protein